MTTPGVSVAFQRCACGREHSPVGWARLHRVGAQGDLVLRNCECGSTCAVHEAEDALAELALARHEFVLVELTTAAPAAQRAESFAVVRLEQRVRDLVVRFRALEDELDARPRAAE